MKELVKRRGLITEEICGVEALAKTGVLNAELGLENFEY
jgi:hypothetical protein